MNKQRKISPADQVDNHRRLLFLAMFLLSLIFGIKTTAYLIDEETKEVLNITAKVLAGLFAIVLISSIYLKLAYIPRKQRHLFNSPDSYVTQVFNQSCRNSWVLTFVLLTLISVTTSQYSSAYPTEFYLNLIMFIMLMVFSLSFFVLFQAVTEEEF